MNMTETLREFMLTPAPSGYEREMAYLLAEKLRPLFAEATETKDSIDL